MPRRAIESAHRGSLTLVGAVAQTHTDCSVEGLTHTVRVFMGKKAQDYRMIMVRGDECAGDVLRAALAKYHLGRGRVRYGRGARLLAAAACRCGRRTCPRGRADFKLYQLKDNGRTHRIRETDIVLKSVKKQHELRLCVERSKKSKRKQKQACRASVASSSSSGYAASAQSARSAGSFSSRDTIESGG